MKLLTCTLLQRVASVLTNDQSIFYLDLYFILIYIYLPGVACDSVVVAIVAV